MVLLVESKLNWKVLLVESKLNWEVLLVESKLNWNGDRTGVAQMHASLKPGLSDSGWEGEQEPASQGAYEALNGIGDQV